MLGLKTTILRRSSRSMQKPTKEDPMAENGDQIRGRLDLHN